MNLARHYQILGLRRGASADDVKAAYRKLVRQYHPDINPDEAAIEQFIKINDAYTALAKAGAKAISRGNGRASKDSSHLDGTFTSLMQTLEKLGFGNADEGVQAATADSSTVKPVGAKPKVGAGRTPAVKPTQAAPTQIAVESRVLSKQEESLKQEAYQQLKDLLRQQKFPRAIALVEGLAHRMPSDIEIIQWQAIVYQRWGRRLIEEGQPQKARIYLKKALRTDPNNRSLWREISRDFYQITQG